ncbi:MAG: hypothetical protein KY392_03995 [Chloroflexi bacterium]|nr:hypothetical protein [Chloroflexota bacterium]
MPSDRALGRYRRWYERLLRLYPRPFRQRFAEPMAQTFNDLARERRGANRDLVGFVAWAFVDATAGIIRENLTQMQTTAILRWVLITAAVLAVPALAMVFNVGVPDPGSGTDGVNWGPMDFAMIGVLVLGSGLLYEYAATRSRSVAHRAAAGIAVAAGLFLVWINLAVGMMDVEPGNLMYVVVLLVALVGTAIGRFEPREASTAMFAAAGAHAVVAVLALVGGLGPILPADAFFVAAWVASALLFRRTGVEPSLST